MTVFLNAFLVLESCSLCRLMNRSKLVSNVCMGSCLSEESFSHYASRFFWQLCKGNSSWIIWKKPLSLKAKTSFDTWGRAVKEVLSKERGCCSGKKRFTYSLFGNIGLLGKKTARNSGTVFFLKENTTPVELIKEATNGV